MKLEYSNSELGKSSDTHALEFGGGAAVPHFFTDFREPAASPQNFLACHWLSHIHFISENDLTWHDEV